MMNPLTSVNKAYTMITSDESQCVTAGSRISGDVHESMALYAGRSNYYVEKGPNSTGRDTHYMEKGPNSMMYLGRGKGTYDNIGSNSHDSIALYTGRGGYINTGNSNYNNSKQKKNWKFSL